MNAKLVIVLFVVLVFLSINILVKAENELVSCSEKDPISQITCYADIAKSKGDVSVCDQSTHQGVRYQCYSIFAEYKQDVNICSKIPSLNKEYGGLKDSCFLAIAKKTKDANICSYVETSTLRDGCYLQISQLTADMSLCEKIQEQAIKNWCYDEPIYVE